MNTDHSYLLGVDNHDTDKWFTNHDLNNNICYQKQINK